MQSEILSTLPVNAREPFLRNLEIVAEACRLTAEKSPRRK